MSRTSSLGDTFDLLANRRRKIALEVLLDRGRPVALADLAEAVAAQENGAANVEPGDETVRTAYLSLYHWHVPKLGDGGVVEFDPDRNSVRVSADGEWVEGFVSLGADGGS